jgi:hypothetical protein
MSRNEKTPDERMKEAGEILERNGRAFAAHDVNAVTAIISDRLGYVTFTERHALAYQFLEWAVSRFALPRKTQLQLDQTAILDSKLDHVRLEIDGYIDSLDEHVTQEDFGVALGKLRLLVTTDVVARPIQAERELKEHREQHRRAED